MSSNMFFINLELKPSKVHGLGLFTHESIKRGTAVYRHDSKLDIILTATMFVRLDQRDQAFILHYGGIDKRLRRYRLPYDNLRFLNHSDSPNVDYDEATDQIIALRDISPGEEILQDYHDFEDNIGSRFAT